MGLFENQFFIINFHQKSRGIGQTQTLHWAASGFRQSWVCKNPISMGENLQLALELQEWHIDTPAPSADSVRAPVRPRSRFPPALHFCLLLPR